MTSLDKLLTNASLPLSEHKPEILGSPRRLAGALVSQLLEMLYKRNGFYALESALHVFPTHSSKDEIGICEWNENTLWRSAYKGFADGCLFFAEDIPQLQILFWYSDRQYNDYRSLLEQHLYHSFSL